MVLEAVFVVDVATGIDDTAFLVDELIETDFAVNFVFFFLDLSNSLKLLLFFLFELVNQILVKFAFFF